MFVETWSAVCPKSNRKEDPVSVLQECPICKTRQKLKNERCACGEDLKKARRSERVQYYISFRMPDGKQRTELVGKSLSDAKAADGKRKAQKKEEPRVLQKTVQDNKTCNEIAQWFLNLESIKRTKYHKILVINLKKFNETFGERQVRSITSTDIENYQAKRKSEGKSDSYVDQEVKAAANMMNRAFQENLVSADILNAFKRVKNLLKRNANARDRILSREEFDRLMANSAPHLKPVIATGYFTGMRLGEILGLTWDRVDLQEGTVRLEAAQTKDGEARVVPVCRELRGILSSIPTGAPGGHVFRYRGRPLKNITSAFEAACKKAEIPCGRDAANGFTFHDLRHTFNTNMRRAGVPESVIMRITGHATRAMFDRYNTVSLADAEDAVKKLSGYLERPGGESGV
jgi:integrase